METLIDVLRGCNSLKRLPKWNKLLPELEYPAIKLNRRITKACAMKLADHKDLLDKLHDNAVDRDASHKYHRTTLRDAMLKAFCIGKPCAKSERKASQLAARLYTMITHDRRVRRGGDEGLDRDADGDVGVRDNATGTGEEVEDHDEKVEEGGDVEIDMEDGDVEVESSMKQQPAVVRGFNFMEKLGWSTAETPHRKGGGRLVQLGSGDDE